MISEQKLLIRGLQKVAKHELPTRAQLGAIFEWWSEKYDEPTTLDADLVRYQARREGLVPAAEAA